MSQDSSGFLLIELNPEVAELNRQTFVNSLLFLFYSTFGEGNDQLFRDLKINKATFWYATNIEPDQFKRPSFTTLVHWCRVLYEHRGKRAEEQELLEQLFPLVGYAAPSQVTLARRTTEHQIPISKSNTDELGNMTNKSYRDAIKKISAGTRQFKTPFFQK